MFKAKLIEHNAYYGLKSKQTLLFFIGAFLCSFVGIYNNLPTWSVVGGVTAFVLVFLFTKINQKGINSIIGDKKIEIDEQEIRIISKNGKGLEVIDLSKVDKLILKEEYLIPGDTTKDLRKELSGSARENFLIVQQNKQERKLDFVIDSYYMIKQLEKLIESWNTQGYVIERSAT